MYEIIYTDPPWSYNSRKAGAERKDKTKFGGGAEKHYPLMEDDELLALKPLVESWAASDCALFMWATCPRLDFGIRLIEHWGFRYCTVAFAWVKTTRDGGLISNPGFYTASNIELVLLGVRGSMRPDQPMIQQVVMAPRGEHSRKPDEVRYRIEQMYPDARRMEMFCRPVENLFAIHQGWDVWGNEAEALYA